MRILLTLLLLSAGLALAQPKPYFPWWAGRFAEDINLSEEQREQIREIQKKYRNVMIDQRAVAEKAEADLQDLFAQDEISDNAAHAAVDRLVRARADMTRSLTEMSIELRRVLTTEQWKELQQKQAEMRSRMMRGRGRNPEGRRPPGPPPPEGGGPPPHPEDHF